MAYPGSTNVLFSLVEDLRFFFQPIQLHLQLADLLIEFRQKPFPISILLLPAIREKTGKFF
jgi:hypothetical protein